jgi:hypothetical protein
MATAPLEYAPAAPRKRRRWGRVVLLLLVVGGTVTVFRKWDRIYSTYFAFEQRARYVRAQQRDAAALVPAGQVVLTDDPAEVAVLGLPGNRDYRVMDWRRQRVSSFGERFDPPHDAVAYSPPDTLAPLRLIGMMNTARLFTHARRSPRGEERIVVVNAQHHFYVADSRTVEITAWPTHRLGYWPYGAPPAVFGSSVSVQLSPADRIRILAGYPDGNGDGAHFTIPYTLNGVAGTFEGRLVSAEKVEWSVTGPAADAVVGSSR